MTKHIELKAVNQGTALATSTLALPPLVIEGLDADSDRSRPLIPTQSGHRFRWKSATDSDRSRPPC